MQKRKLSRIFVSFGLAFTLTILSFLFSNSKIYQILELKSFDLRFILRGARTSVAPIVHIDIDDASINKLSGRWPWPRGYHAELVNILKECGAKYVIFDVLFTEKVHEESQEDAIFAEAISNSGIVYLPFYFTEGRTPPPSDLHELLLQDITMSIDDIASTLKVDVVSLKDKLIPAKKYVIDEVLNEMVRRKPDISLEELFLELENSRSWYLFPTEETYIKESLPSHKLTRFFVNRFSVECSGKENEILKDCKVLNVPIEEYLVGIRGSGYINAKPDSDGVMRRVPLLIRYEEKVFPHITLSALIDYLSVKNIQIKHRSIILKEARINNEIKDIVIPIDDTGCMLINWTGRWADTFEHLPYYSVLILQDARDRLRQELKKDKSAVKDQAMIEYLQNSEKELKKKLAKTLKDKICLVGLTATATQDVGPIPLQANYPFVGVNANLIDTIISGEFLKKEKGTLKFFVFLLSALVIGIGSLFSLWRSLLISVCYMIVYFTAAFFAFDKFGLWVDLVGPLGIIIFGFSAITGFRYFTEESEKRWIKKAFSHYLSAEVINELMDDPSKLKLGGERKNLTVLFSDVRGFTKFSESHQPEKVVAMLNEILTEQVKVVFEYNGTLDKFVGDELMTFFGAPGDIHTTDHPIVGLRTAIKIQEKLRELKEKWSQEKKEALQIGIGINSGDMVVGNMGSVERMDYTVIGDNVNLASRLCAVAGPGEILISQSTYEYTKDQIIAEALEPISVKGKSKPVSIYRVVGLK